MNFSSVFKTLCIVLTGMCLFSGPAGAVTSQITVHKDSEDFLKGKTEQVMIDSDGTLQLAHQTEPVDLGIFTVGLWTINTIAAQSDGTLHLGTSPDGMILTVRPGGAVEVPYPMITEETVVSDDPNEQANAPFRNEHVFALTYDVAGRLLAGISGQKAKLIRFDPEENVLFESEEDHYIFSILLDHEGNIFLATGPEGRIYRMPPFGGTAELVYDSREKNILTMAFAPDGTLIAGSDTRGLVYRINPETKEAQILYNSKQTEITALAVDSQGTIYAAASSAAAVVEQITAASQALNKAPGRPDAQSSKPRGMGGTSLKTANTSDEDENNRQRSMPSPPPPPGAPKQASSIYRITPDGFVTEIFSEKAIFYSLTLREGILLAATGNDGRLYSINPATEQRAIVYDDEKAVQVTAALPVDDGLVLALANPAGIIRVMDQRFEQGTYLSDLLDAEQPARWGKLQIEAAIPNDTEVLLAARSGNVDDPNDPTFSDWSAEQEITAPVEMNCPVARYAQYRLTLKTDSTDKTPVIREVAVAHSIPNLAPKVSQVAAQRGKDKTKPWEYQLAAKAEDDNKDTMIYHFEFRKLSRTSWIMLEQDADKPVYEWDTRTVEDGRYEVRITADDKPSNSPAEALTGSRISDPFVIDNTAPTVEDPDLQIENDSIKLTFRAVDAYSAIGKAQFTLDSNEDWSGLAPDDRVFDTLSESMTLELKDLPTGDHVLALQVSDNPGNTGYHTIEFAIP